MSRPSRSLCSIPGQQSVQKPENKVERKVRFAKTPPYLDSFGCEAVSLTELKITPEHPREKVSSIGDFKKCFFERRRVREDCWGRKTFKASRWIGKRLRTYDPMTRNFSR